MIDREAREDGRTEEAPPSTFKPTEPRIVRYYVALTDAGRGYVPKVGCPRRDVAVDAPINADPEDIERAASVIERKPRDRVFIFGIYGGF